MDAGLIMLRPIHHNAAWLLIMESLSNACLLSESSSDAHFPCFTHAFSDRQMDGICSYNNHADGVCRPMAVAAPPAAPTHPPLPPRRTPLMTAAMQQQGDCHRLAGVRHLAAKLHQTLGEALGLLTVPAV